MKHLSNETIYNYFDNELDDNEKQKVKAHLLECDLCNKEYRNVESLKLNFQKFSSTNYEDSQFVSSVMGRVLEGNSINNSFFKFFENWLIPVCSFSCALFILLNNGSINYTDKPQNILLATEGTSDMSDISLESLLGQSINEGWL